VARRRNPDFTTFFTFGGRVPASVGMLLAAMVAASVWGWMDRGLLAFAALAPVAILNGQLWRLVTWPFFQDNPFGLLFGGFMLWSFGQQLSYAWSERRFVLRFFGFVLGAGVATTVLALFWNDARMVGHVGVWPVIIALLVSWAMLFPDRQVNIWGILPLTGKTLALLVVFGTVLYALSGGFPRGFAVFAPHLFAIAIAWVQSRGSGGSQSWRQARRWWSDREAKRRAKHLKVLRKNGPDDESRWLN
jgi:membrane associated rhomboid family serine protease